MKEMIFNQVLLSSINEEKRPSGVKMTRARRRDNMRIKVRHFMEDKRTESGKSNEQGDLPHL